MLCSTGSPDVSLVNLEGLEELVKEDGNTEEGDRHAERHEDFVNQKQNLDETNALVSEVLTSEIEDTDEENDSDTESLVSPFDFSADEVEARVMKLLTPEEIENSRLTVDEVDAYLDSIGPKIPFEPPSGKGTLNHY